jgi:E3 ubiquitin-protein ligase MARCH6
LNSTLFDFLGVYRENIASDILQGCAVVTLTLLAFIGLVWLREQILHGGGPEWLEMEAPHLAEQQPVNHHLPAADIPVINVVDADGLVDAVDLPAEPAAPEILEEVGNNDINGANNPNGNNELNLGDDGQWNPMEWDRAAEELTWERLLGLDGSLVFLEHVFWVVSLNTLFILVFGTTEYSTHHAEGLVNPKVRVQKKVTDFGLPRACRFRKHQIKNRSPTFFKT